MGNQKERVVVLDLAIFLLKLSFYAFLVAFMRGLYVTTFPIASSPILACTLCSLLILLIRQRLVMSAMHPIIKIASVSRKPTFSFSDFLFLTTMGSEVNNDILFSNHQMN